MSGFVVLPEAQRQPAGEIHNDGWFPDIDPDALRDARRIRDVVTAGRLRDAVLGAILTVNNDLQIWADRQRAAGWLTLDAMPATRVDGEHRLVLLYRRAIGATAKAELVEAYRGGTDVTGRGERQQDELEPSIGELRRDALHAIRDILGVGRTTVELI